MTASSILALSSGWSFDRAASLSSADISAKFDIWSISS